VPSAHGDEGRRMGYHTERVDSIKSCHSRHLGAEQFPILETEFEIGRSRVRGNLLAGGRPQLLKNIFCFWCPSWGGGSADANPILRPRG